MKNTILPKLLLAALIFFTFSCKKAVNENPTVDDSMPVAMFEWTGTQRVNSEIQFTNKSLYGDSYKWDFGDGQTSTKAVPDKIKYTTENVYEVLLTVVKGNRKAFYKQLIAISDTNDPSPFYTYEFVDGKSTTPAKVKFKNQSINADTYEWKIDGTTYTEANPTHTFNKAGKYTVTLSARKGTQEVTYGNTVTIDENTDPQASFVFPYHPFPYQINETIQLVNTSKNADIYEWNFGNGQTSTLQHPEVKFTVPGNYVIKLVASKGGKQSAPRQITLKIN